ncbi:MAG: hypothetical protein GX447_06600 [Elusimicrobia bacterium]|nr:hypothetical protein [Elusimicrobiota bacterium]
MSFSKIKGNSKLISSFKELIKTNSFPSCSLFYGPPGIGKFMTAFEIAKTHFCSGKSGEDISLFSDDNKGEEKKEEACGKCEECIRVEKRLHPDFRIVDAKFQASLLDEPEEKQKTIKIDTLREIASFAYEKPYISSDKFIIIDKAETMTHEAQNSLLKILEEPPQSAKIILISNDKNLLLQTIVSRVFPFKFLPLSGEDLAEILGNFSIEEKDASFLSDISGGSVGKALEFSKLLEEFRSKKHLGKLLPFSMLPARTQTYEQRAKTALVLDFLAAAAAKDKINPPLNFSRKAKEINNLLSYSLWLKHNVSPKIIMELALNDYLKYGNFDFGEKL